MSVTAELVVLHA